MNIYKPAAVSQAALSDSHGHTHRHVPGCVVGVVPGSLGGGYLEMSFTGWHQNCPAFLVSFSCIGRKRGFSF